MMHDEQSNKFMPHLQESHRTKLSSEKDAEFTEELNHLIPFPGPSATSRYQKLFENPHVTAKNPYVNGALKKLLTSHDCHVIASVDLLSPTKTDIIPTIMRKLSQ